MLSERPWQVPTAVECRSERDALLAKVKQAGDAADQPLKDVKWDPSLKHLLCDRLIVSTALQLQGDALQHAAKELRDDYDVVLAAVKQNGRALRFASHRLKLDPEIGDAAVKQNVHAQYWIDQVRCCNIECESSIRGFKCPSNIGTFKATLSVIMREWWAPTGRWTRGKVAHCKD